MAENLGAATLYLGTDDAQMEKGLKDAERSTSKAFGAMRTLAVGAGVAAAGAIAAIGVSAFNVSKDTDKATKRIKAQLRTTEKEAKRLGKAAKAVFKNNFADSIEESGEAVMLLSEQLGDAARGQEQVLAEAAFGLRDAFGPEIDKVIAAVSTLTEEFDDLDPTQAFDLITAGFQQGLDKSGDFLESIGEYSNLFADADFSASEFFSTMESGQAGGVLGTDKIADAMKEFQVRLIEGSEAVSEGSDGRGVKRRRDFRRPERWHAQRERRVGPVDPGYQCNRGSAGRNRALVELLGTQAEDLGLKFTESLDDTKFSLDEVKGASESLNEQYKTLTDGIAGLWRNVIVEVSPLTDLLVSMGGTHLPAISKWVTDTLPGVVTAMTGFLTDPLNTMKNMFALPDKDVFLIKLKFRWAIIKKDFQDWLTTAAERITDFFESPATKAFFIKLKFQWLIIKRDFNAWLTSAAQRITDFFAAPLSDPLLQALQSTWTTVKNTFKTWVVDHLVADYIQLPDNVTWSNVLKAVWTSVSAVFKSWVVDHLIADYVKMPDDVTWSSALKGVWETVQSGFQSWVVDHLVADYIQLPDNVTWSNVLKAVWTSVSGGFKTWVVDHLIADYVKMPDDVTWSSALKGVWETVQADSRLGGDHLVADYIQLPDNVTWSNVLKAVWTSVSGGFKTWVVDHLIADYVKMPDDVTWSSALKGVWETVQAGFKTWVVDHLIADYVKMPDDVTWLDLIKGVWETVKAGFKTWVVDHLIADYVKMPDDVTWLDLIKGVWETVKAGFKAWVVDHLVADYIQLPDNVTWSNVLKAVWTSVSAGFKSWMTTANMKISEFWQLPAVQVFVQKLRDMWDGPEGVKTTFEKWLSKPENRPKIAFGYEAPDSESEETRGFFSQLKQTMLAGLDAIFGDIDIIGSLLAPIIAILATDPAAGFQGIIDKIAEALRTVESVFNAADEAIDTFFENFNPDTIGPLVDAWAAAIGAKLSEWSAGIGEGFRSLWGWITDIWTGGGDGINTITGEKFAAIQLKPVGQTQIYEAGFPNRLGRSQADMDGRLGEHQRYCADRLGHPDDVPDRILHDSHHERTGVVGQYHRNMARRMGRPEHHCADRMGRPDDVPDRILRHARQRVRHCHDLDQPGLGCGLGEHQGNGQRRVERDTGHDGKPVRRLWRVGAGAGF